MDENLSDAEVEAIYKLADDVQKLNKRLLNIEESMRVQTASMDEKYDRIIDALEKMMPTPKSESEPLAICFDVMVESASAEIDLASVDVTDKSDSSIATDVFEDGDLCLDVSTINATQAEVTSDLFSADFSSVFAESDAVIGEESFEIKFCVSNYFSDFCLLPVCENASMTWPTHFTMHMDLSDRLKHILPSKQKVRVLKPPAKPPDCRVLKFDGREPFPGSYYFDAKYDIVKRAFVLSDAKSGEESFETMFCVSNTISDLCLPSVCGNASVNLPPFGAAHRALSDDLYPIPLFYKAFVCLNPPWKPPDSRTHIEVIVEFDDVVMENYLEGAEPDEESKEAAGKSQRLEKLSKNGDEVLIMLDMILDELDSSVSLSAAQGAKLVMLPEIWNSPYSNDSFPVYAEVPWRNTSKHVIAKAGVAIRLKSFCEARQLDEAVLFVNHAFESNNKPSIWMCNHLIDLLGKGKKYEPAFSVKRKMDLAGIVPSFLTFDIMVGGYVHENRHHLGPGVAGLITKHGFVVKRYVVNLIIKTLLQNGEMSKATELFRLAGRNGLAVDVVSYNTTINGLCKAQKMEEAHNLFIEMESNNCSPNLVTHSILMDGLCKSGKVEEAMMLLNKYELLSYSLQNRRPSSLPPENDLKIGVLDEYVAELENGVDSLFESSARFHSQMLSVGQIAGNFGDDACFNIFQREAIKDARRIAGLEVIRSIDEHTVIFMEYEFEKKNSGQILVFDPGGGTFNVSVHKEFANLYVVEGTSLMNPAITVLLVNLIAVAVAVGVSKTIYNVLLQWSKLNVRVLFSFWVLTKFMAYDYMYLGSLPTLVHGNIGASRTLVSWEMRFGIILGAASGIAFPHMQGSGVYYGHTKSASKSYEFRGHDFSLSQLASSSYAKHLIALAPAATPHWICPLTKLHVATGNNASAQQFVYNWLRMLDAHIYAYGWTTNRKKIQEQFIMFSSPRPSEVADLEDKVNFMGRGMLRNGIIMNIGGCIGILGNSLTI